MAYYDAQRSADSLQEMMGAFDLAQYYKFAGIGFPWDRVHDSSALRGALDGILRRLVQAEADAWQEAAEEIREEREVQEEAVRAVYDAWDGDPDHWGDSHRDLLRMLLADEDEDWVVNSYIRDEIWQGWDGDWETLDLDRDLDQEDPNDTCDDMLRELDWAKIARSAAEEALPDLIVEASDRAEDLLADRDDFGWDGLNLRAYGRRYGDFDSGWAGGFLVTLTDGLRLQVQWIDDQGEHEPEIVDFSADALYAEFCKINVPDPRI